MLASSQVGGEKEARNKLPKIVVYLIGRESNSPQLAIEREIELGSVVTKLKPDVGPRLKRSITPVCNQG